MKRNIPHQSVAGKRTQNSSRREFFLIVTLLVPVAFFVLVELVLRASHYGPNLDLFAEVQFNGVPYETMNSGVSRRYFFRTDFQPGSSPDIFLREKNSKTIRIFCLGASTTVGFPYWYNAAFPTFLRQRLARMFPDRNVEVVNLGITATNSFTVLDMARSIVHEHPDAIVVYDGHNEFYGALGVASRESMGQMRWVAACYLSMLRSKTFLLLRDAISFAVSLFESKDEETDRTTMMERIAGRQLVPYTSSIYRTGIATFRANLEELEKLCADDRVPLLLCTQPSNLRDLPPFVSVHPPSVPPSLCATSDSALHAGEEALQKGRFVEARRALSLALSADSSFALTHFRLGNVSDSLGEYPAAGLEYRMARDLDAARFRASEDVNRLIRESGHGALPVDIESTFAAASPHHLIGANLIMEHLHPSSYGHYLISNAIFDAMKSRGVLCSPEEWTRRDSVAVTRYWEDRVMTPLDEKIAGRKTEILRSGWPFRAIQATVSSVTSQDTLGQIAELVTRGIWTWRRAHEAALAFASSRGDGPSTDAEYRTILSQYALDPLVHARYGAFLGSIARPAEARKELTRSLELGQTAIAYLALGDLDLSEGNAMSAIGSYRKSLPLEQSHDEQSRIHVSLALAHLKLGDPAEAQRQLQLALDLNPSNAQARSLLQHFSRP